MDARETHTAEYQTGNRILHTYFLHDLQNTWSSIISPATYLSFNQLFTFHFSHQPRSPSYQHSANKHADILSKPQYGLSSCLLCFSSYLRLSARALMREGNYIFNHRSKMWRLNVSVGRCRLIAQAHIQYTVGWKHTLTQAEAEK